MFLVLTAIIVLVGAVINPVAVESAPNSKWKRSLDAAQCQSTVPNDQTLIAAYSQSKGNNPLPFCTCGSNGEISQIKICNTTTQQSTTFQLCQGCIGAKVLLGTTSTCLTVNAMFRGSFGDLCPQFNPTCIRTIKFYRCGECSVQSAPATVPTTTTTTTTTITTPPTTSTVVITPTKKPFSTTYPLETY